MKNSQHHIEAIVHHLYLLSVESSDPTVMDRLDDAIKAAKALRQSLPNEGL